MSHLNTLHKLIPNILIKFLHNLVKLKTLLLFCLVTLLAIIVWQYGPLLNYQGYYLIAEPQKRVYIIIGLYLIWLLELLITDVDIINPQQFSDHSVQKKLLACQNRFHGAMQFLKKTRINKYGKQIHLSQLPWVLLIGPAKAGKTCLLANANIRFILQRQFSKQEGAIESTSQADWWVTPENTLVDIPGCYLSQMNAATMAGPKAGFAAVLWQFFLQLTRKYRGKEGINGIALVLPLAELVKHPDSKILDTTVNQMTSRLNELQAIFQQPIPVTLILSKCDLFTGFKEYFAELGNDEATQAWGISFSDLKDPKEFSVNYKQRFNALIKKINEQLLTRLHQERSSTTRPHIKEFPLELERVKGKLQEVAEKLQSACPQLELRGIYLTSAHQQQGMGSEKALSHAQLLDVPGNLSRTLFIRQLLSIGLSNGKVIKHKMPLGHKLVYLFSATLIVTTGVLLGRDFESGLKNVYALQKQITDYQQTSKQFHNRDEKLNKTLALLNNLHQATKMSKFKIDLNHLLSFYTFKSQETAGLLYQQAIQNILVPQVKNYLEDFLKLPVNKSSNDLYSALKAYLMLGNRYYFDADFVSDTMHKITPKSISDKQAALLQLHLNLAFKSHHDNYPLKENIYQEARDYLTAHAPLELSELILANMGNNNEITQIHLIRDTGEKKVLVPVQTNLKVRRMYTSKNFPGVMTRQLTLAAREAILGNWVLGEIKHPQDYSIKINELHKELKEHYIQKYAASWERILDNIKLEHPKNLAQANNIISTLVGSSSPLLQMLQTVRDNTFLKPISAKSSQLKQLSLLLDKNKLSEKQLYQIFSGLQSLHQYIKPVVASKDSKKIAFNLIKQHMQHKTVDPITQLRLIADKNPQPLKKWLNQLANDTWSHLSKEAGSYLNTAWNEEVIKEFNTSIANRYPFNAKSSNEVDLQAFKHFFGNPGTIVSFYNDNLKYFIDRSKPIWHWKDLGDNSLTFSKPALSQIQQAMRIHQTFFPNGDNELFVQFALSPYQFGKNVKKVKVKLSNKEIVDEKAEKTSHMFTWPGKDKNQATLVELTLDKDKSLKQNIAGDWSWFKLVNQSFDSVVSKQQIALNLSNTDQPARYYLHTKGKTNPFISLNMKHFKLQKNLV